MLPHPPGPGFPLQAPSVNIVITGVVMLEKEPCRLVIDLSINIGMQHWHATLASTAALIIGGQLCNQSRWATAAGLETPTFGELQ